MALSRWSYNPVRGEDGRPKVARLTERDIEIFKLLAKFRYLPKDYIAAFIGGGVEGLGERLELLTRQPNRYLDRPDGQQASAHANYRFMIYEVAPRGVSELKALGFSIDRPTSTPFPHEVMVCHIAASIDLALKADRELCYVPFGSRFLETKIDGTQSRVISDWPAFALGKEGARKFYFGFEADTGTEQKKIRRGSSVGRKFLEYVRIIADRSYKPVFNTRTFYVPFVFASERSMRNAMVYFQSAIDPSGSEFVLFKHIPLFWSATKPLRPSGHIVTEPWQRVGHPDFFMAHEKGTRLAASPLDHI